MSTNIKAFITDFDGTLAFTYAANLAAYQRAIDFATDGAYKLTNEVYSECFGYRFNDFMDAINITNENIRLLIKEKKAEYYATYASSVVINNDLLSTLKFAKLNGVKVALATTARFVNIMTVLKTHNIDTEIFDLILTGEDVKEGKPNPEIYLTAMKALNVKPEETIVFEDSDIGIEAAVKAGCNYIKVLW